MLPQLNLPEAALKIEDNQVWDRLRKKYVPLTPEEWVRQNFIAYLIKSMGYSEGLMVSEHLVHYNGQKKRCDIAVFNSSSDALIIVECKAPKVKLSEDTFYQLAKYNSTLQAPVLILTNGLEHFCAFVNYNENKLEFLKKIPDREELKQLID